MSTGDTARGMGLLVKATIAVVGIQGFILGLLLLLVVVAGIGVVGFSSEDPDCDTAGDPNYTSSGPSEEAVSDIPEDYYNLYKQAAEEYNIDWAILAAVGKIESDHGRLDAPGVTEGQNEYGCCAGPMQFDNNYGNGGGTWDSIAVDGNGDGEKDIYDPEDAIPSAAKYLVDGGAPDDYDAALFQYNNAQWYVDDVMAQADKYRAADGGADSEEPGTSPALLPFTGLLMSEAQAQEGSSPEGSGEPPQGWDLVDDTDKTMYYEIEDTTFASEFEAAAEEWNALGGVDIKPTPSGEQTDIVVSDAPLGGPLGTTSSEGTIQFDPRVAEGIGSSARLSASIHELGHALGFGHTTSESVMQEAVAIGEENPTSPTGYDRELYKEVWGGSAEDGDSTESSPTPPSEEVSRACDEGGPGGSGSGSGGGGFGSGSYPTSNPPDGGTGQSEDTPGGWDLVENESKTMTYYSETRFDSYAEAAVEEWNALGGVSLQPADSAEEANVVFRDVGPSQWEYGQAMGYTKTTNYATSQGEILVNAARLETTDETGRQSLMIHELGHALGFVHQNGKESVMDQGWDTGMHHDVPTELDIGIYRDVWGGDNSNEPA